MTIDMDDSKITTLVGIRKFLKGAAGLKLKGLSRDEKYAWLNRTLQRFGYFKLRKKEKAILKRYTQIITGYSDAQITRLITRKRRNGRIAAGAYRSPQVFPECYYGKSGSKKAALQRCLRNSSIVMPISFTICRSNNGETSRP